MVHRIQHGLTSSSKQHLYGMGIVKTMALVAHSLHSCSQLVRNRTSVQNELSKDWTTHLEESIARIQADNSDSKEVVGKAIPVH